MKETKIEWTDATHNFWHGCQKISPGCKYCYMFRDKERYGMKPTKIVRAKRFYEPVKWKEPKLIFTCSWSDFFIEEADDWRDEAWQVIRDTPQHTWQILTKRPENIPGRLPPDWGDGYKNVWLGISAENSDLYQKRADILNEIPARLKFVSFEPLLERIEMFSIFTGSDFKPDWAIVGAESGNNTGKYRYRECKGHWIYRIVSACQQFGVPVFVKQLGTYIAEEQCLKDRHGRDIDEFCDELKVRQMPTIK